MGRRIPLESAAPNSQSDTIVRAATKKLTNCPAWLTLSEDRTSFVFMPERAKIVRRIFKLSIAGFGGYTIANQLNAKKVPAFGPAPKWDQSTIHNMLRNRATIGEYHPKKYRDKKPPDEIGVANYYPAVIEESLFNAAQEARQRNLTSGRGRKGRLITNLLEGLTKCSYCGSRLKFHSNGQGTSLVCETVLDGRGCYRFRWSLQDLEGALFECIENTKAYPGFSEQLALLRVGVQNQSEREIYDARAEISQILKTIVLELRIASAGVNPVQTQPDARIRRDHPDRYFTVTFSDGSVRTGYPAPFLQIKTGRAFDPVDLSRSLGITPRQGALTALLAEGKTLKKAACDLGISLETARWHLREIFKKTKTHSQSELVNLAEQPAVALSPSPRTDL